MSIVHSFPLSGPLTFACAQAGCATCLEALMRRHEGLVHHILRRQVRGTAAYEDLLQEGRIALWQAIMHFDPQRGVAFSTYAGVAIQRRIWRAARRVTPPPGILPQETWVDVQELAEENVWHAAVREALDEAVARLPTRLCQVINAAYGLDGQPPCTLAAIGRHFGVTREMARYWRNEGLVLLRLPGLAGRLRQLCGQESRQAYARSQALSRTWLRRRRGRR